MGTFQKFVEWATDARYVAPGKQCDLCGAKLPFLETGFWSTNATPLRDGVICKNCYKKLVLLEDYRDAWLPVELHKQAPFSFLRGDKLFLLNVQKAVEILEAAETMARKELAALSQEYTAVFRMRDAVFIEPTALQVGLKRAKLLEGKLVLFGFVQLGQFQQGDRVLIRDGDSSRETTILEAYAFDCEENTLEIELKAHMGKQVLGQWQSGWLVLEDTETVSKHAAVIG
jgi:hypothetical protein